MPRFFYHTLEHMRLLLEARRLRAEYVIVDTSISPVPEPSVALGFEAVDDPRHAVEYGGTGAGKALVEAPSKSGLLVPHTCAPRRGRDGVNRRRVRPRRRRQRWRRAIFTSIF
jgi:hypothetical protein